MIKLWLDCDGVLADFDKHFLKLTGMNSALYENIFGSAAFWKVINNAGTFFLDLEPMPDAYELFDAVKHLNPTILTGGSSQTDKHKTTEHKNAWVKKYFPGTPVIVTESAIKYTHMHPEVHNIIIDDWKKHKHVWEREGGTFILHSNTKKSIKELDQVLYNIKYNS